MPKTRVRHRGVLRSRSAGDCTRLLLDPRRHLVDDDAAALHPLIVNWPRVKLVAVVRDAGARVALGQPREPHLARRVRGGRVGNLAA
eukprot:6356700-Prymnesium_polylepis.1